MDASEVIRETRLSMFEGEWEQGPSGCLLAHASKVCGGDDWSKLETERPDVVHALAQAVDTKGDLGALPQDYKAQRFDGFRVFTYNDMFGRTFDEIVEVTEIAEKFAAINEETSK